MDNSSAEPFHFISDMGLGFADKLIEHMLVDSYYFGIVVLCWDHFNEHSGRNTWPFL